MGARWSALRRAASGAGTWLSANPRTVTTLLFAAALAPRLWVALRWSAEPVWDGHYYHFGAQRIAAGLGYSDDVATPAGLVWSPWCHYPVGYSGFLALFYAILGASPAVGTAAGALVGAATVAAVHRLALTFLSPVRALLAAVVCGAHPGLVLYSALLMTEPLAGLGLVLAPLAYLRLERRPTWAACAAGLLLGLTTLVRPQTVLLAPAVALLASRASWRARVAAGLIATAACFATVAPWTVRNCVRMDACAFVSTNAGWNLAIGSSPRATGRFEPLRSEDGCRVVTGQVQQDRCWVDQGMTWIRSDPRAWLALAPKKLSFTFDHQSFAVGYLAQADPFAWPEERRASWRALLGTTQYVLLLFAALGALLLPSGTRRGVALAAGLGLTLVLFADGLASDPRRAWPLALLLPILALLPPRERRDRGLVGFFGWTVATLILVHVVFFGEDRYQVAITPALCVLAAASLRPQDHAQSS